MVLLANEVHGYINSGINCTLNTGACFNSFVSKISDLTGKCKRAAYDAGFKLREVELAEQSSNCAAAREFGVNEKIVRYWRQKKDVLSALPKTKKTRRDDVASFPELEVALNNWVLECRQNGFIVTWTSIRLRAFRLSKKSMSTSSAVFVASAGWCTHFMNRYGLVLWQKTKITQKLPADLEAKIDSFHKFVI